MYIVGASILSIVERYLKSVIWINNLDQVITTKSLVTLSMLKEFVLCGGLLFIRYAGCVVVWVSHIQIPQLIECRTTKAVILNSVYSHKEGVYSDLWKVYEKNNIIFDVII